MASRSKPGRFLGSQSLFNKVQDECKPCLAMEKILPIQTIEFIADTDKHYDAIIQFPSNNNVEVECVTAMNQFDWALRREHMDKYGRVSKYGDILTTVGTQNTRIIQYTPCQTISDVEAIKKTVDEFNQRILPAFLNKVEKQDKFKIYQNTVLLIYIDDTYYPVSYQALIEPLHIIAQLIKKHKHDFKGIYIVGTSGNVVEVTPFCF